MKPENALLQRPIRAAWVAIGVTWLVLVATVAGGSFRLRGQLRDQMIRRDADVLLEMAWQTTKEFEEMPVLADGASADIWTRVDYIWRTIGAYRGTLAARLFDEDGDQIEEIPTNEVDLVHLGQTELRTVLSGVPVCQFHPEYPIRLLTTDARLRDVSKPEPSAGFLPMIDVLIPLAYPTNGPVRGVGGYLIRGDHLIAAYDRLDRQLAMQAGLVLTAAMALSGGVLGWAFRRLERARAQLARRTQDLQRANQELSQSARSAALGAITAHLVHGLRNPVSGLQSFVSARPEAGEGEDAAWQEAAEATRRMQGLIQEVLGVLREHDSDLAFEVTLREVGESVIQRVGKIAGRHGVRVRLAAPAAGCVDNRSSGLLALVLTNLVENAIEASPAGAEVWLRGEFASGLARWEVIDSGPGLTPGARERLFRPQSSTKEGGSGLGLAITRQLAVAIGASVDLVSSGPEGTIFRVTVPSPSPGRSEPEQSLAALASTTTAVPPV